MSGDLAVDLDFDRHREGQVRRRLPGERELVAATLLDQLRQGGLLEIDVEEPAVILARHLLHVRDILLRGAEARLEIARPWIAAAIDRSEEHTSELQSLMRISYAVFCLKKKKTKTQSNNTHNTTHHN